MTIRPFRSPACRVYLARMAVVVAAACGLLASLVILGASLAVAMGWCG